MVPDLLPLDCVLGLLLPGWTALPLTGWAVLCSTLDASGCCLVPQFLAPTFCVPGTISSLRFESARAVYLHSGLDHLFSQVWPGSHCSALCRHHFKFSSLKVPVPWTHPESGDL